MAQLARRGTADGDSIVGRSRIHPDKSMRRHDLIEDSRSPSSKRP